MISALIRVSRKRGADPHEALVLHNKRAKQAPPLVFTLYKAAATQNDQELEGHRCLDLPKPENVENVENERIDVEEPLAFVGDDVTGIMGREEVAKTKNEPEQVMLNGRLLQAVEKRDDEEMVFDYYQISDRHGLGVNWEQHIDELDVRFANRNELLLDEEGDDSDGPVPDDEDDSNDEGNWRNDYPDEDSYEENSDHDDPYGELVAENWHGGRFPHDDDLHLRLQNVAINERYEAYFEGEDTDDEDEDVGY